ncbi:hypothetical protein ITJ50_00750 [Curtobacterium sp. VKM Ac-2889]|uniref:hypothetical protein n=1 Tax=unclassified Curtobacterium TaxID=257496 RepID=UPI00188C9B16|nr:MULTISPECIES: hypothetical protein [unclassified Curtobacterium]MBF4597209.1 hypothetical protein [Curtobacterium sp. VKM Ac-1796]MBF4609747.1 hypothetical protein [Curtobacterium sp. VKM Ac-2889]
MNGIQVRMTQSVITQPRFEIDPNQVSRRNPGWNTAELAEGPNVRVGQSVTVVQPDEEDSDFIGTAVVEFIDPEFDLVYLRVDWSSFHAAEAAWKVENFASPTNLSKFIGTVAKRAAGANMPWVGNTTTTHSRKVAAA